MKSYHFFGLALLSATIFTACDPNANPANIGHVSRPDSIYVYTIGNKDVEYFNYAVYYQYDSKGNVLSETKYFSSHYIQKEEPFSKVEMKYDSKNRLIEKRIYYYHTNTMELLNIDQWLYTYDSNNKVENILVNDITEGTEIPAQKMEFSWTDTNHATENVYNNTGASDVQWTLSYRADYVYNKFGKVDSVTTFRNYQPDGSYSYIVEYSATYDQYGNILSEKEQIDSKVGNREFTYSYDEQGNILFKFATYSSSSVIVSTREKHVYFY
jgi:hypothetical protein